MRNRLPATPKNEKYIESLPKIYLVGYWAHYGVREFPFAGKYKKSPTIHGDVPLVWQYDDKNGTDNAYYLRPIYLTTTGLIKVWTFYENAARDIADTYNELEKLRKEKK